MARSNDSWGIEVGAKAVKAIRLVRQGGEVAIAEYDILPFKEVLTTPDLNVDEAIQLRLDKFLSRNDVQKSTVVVSVPGNTAFAKFAKLPPVDPKKIPDIVNFEAVQQIPFPIEQVEWDYQVFAQPDSPDVEVGIFAITKERVARFLSNYNAVGMTVDGLTLSALAVYNAMAYDMELDMDSPGVILVDIGSASTDVIIVAEGTIWLRTLPIGGNNFTQALIRAFKLSFKKAEKLKREAGTSKYSRQIFQAMRPVFSDLVQEMQRTLGYYQSLNRDAKLNKLIGFGSTFRLPGLQKFLKQQLQLDVVRPNGFKRITVEGKQAADFADKSLNLATAYGLALQGLGVEEVTANILPQPIIRRRLWQAKQPWLAGAAAILVAVTAASWAKLKIDEHRFDSNMKIAQPRVAQVRTQAQDFVDKWGDIETRADPRQRIENLRRILDYRDLWPKLMQDLTLATQAMNPQRTLLLPNYDKIAKIPRDQRRRIYIDQVKVVYQFDAPNVAAAGQTIDEIWPPLEEDNSRAPSPTRKPKPAVDPPSFLITVTGTTPFREGPKLISQYFINWLKQNANRADRPYKIIATQQSLVRVEKLSAADLGTDRRADPGAGGAPRAAGRGAPIAAGRGSTQDPRMFTTSWMDSMLPQRPEATERAEGDHYFEIEWTVQLSAPDSARQAEEKTAPAHDADPAKRADSAQPDTHTTSGRGASS